MEGTAQYPVQPGTLTWTNWWGLKGRCETVYEGRVRTVCDNVHVSTQARVTLFTYLNDSSANLVGVESDQSDRSEIKFDILCLRYGLEAEGFCRC